MDYLPPKMQAQLEAVLPRDLATLAHMYIMPRMKNWHKYFAIYVGQSGHWEMILEYGPQPSPMAHPRHSWECILNGACKAGDMDVVDLAISKGARDWKFGLSGACSGNHIELIAMMIYLGNIDGDEFCGHCLKKIKTHHTKEWPTMSLAHAAQPGENF